MNSSPIEDRIRLAVVGVGIAGQSHLLDAVTSSEIEVVAVCSRRKESVEGVAADFGVSFAYSNFHAMLDEQSLDAVIIATPPNVIATLTATSLRAGLDVVAEKPLATAQHQLDNLNHVLLESGRSLVVAYTRRYRKAWSAARKWISDGQIGKLLEVECLWRGPYRERYSPTSRSYRADPSQRVAGVFLDSGSHALDAVLYLTGQIGNVLQANLIIDDMSGADIGGNVVLEQSGGAKVLLDIQDISSVEEIKTVRLIGTVGSIEVDDYSARLNTNDGSKVEILDGYWQRPVDDLLAIRKSQHTFGASLAEACETVRCLIYIYSIAQQPIRNVWRRPRAKAWARLNGAC
jgi:predicted dehydrogenase